MDPAGTFQRRHQTRALTLVLGVLRARYETADDLYDIAQVRRSYEVDAQRQIVSTTDTSVYRSRRDDLDAIGLIESEPEPEGLLDAAFSVGPIGDCEAGPEVEIEHDPAIPGFRQIAVSLPRGYSAGELVEMTWTERLRFGPDAPDWGRSWAHVNVLNDHFELELSVQFAEDAELPDLCWWFDVEPITDLGEIGPKTLGHLVDLSHSRLAIKRWEPAETERRRLYGFIWCWFDGDEPAEWQTAKNRLAD